MPATWDGRVSPDDHIRALLARDRLGDAATRLLQQLGPGVLRYLRATLRNEADVAEAFSQFAENVWKGLGTFRFDCTLRSWAYRVARNVAADLRRHPWQRRRRLATTEAHAIAEQVRTRTHERVALRRRWLDDLVRSLPEREQSLLFLRIDRSLPWAEIAAILSPAGRPLDPPTVMKRYERLTVRLEKMARGAGLLD